MTKFTTDLYEIKRNNIVFSEKITKGVGQVESKFVKEMIYGITKSSSIIISNISDALHEDIKKINTIERLSNNLTKEISSQINDNYLKEVNKVIGKEPIILVDDSDVIKPYGKQFEYLSTVRDGSSKDKSNEKGYQVTEMVVLSEKENHPISLFSHIHSSKEEGYKSSNSITFRGLDEIIEKVNRKCTFIFDRGYDMNELYKYLFRNDQQFIIRVTERRKIFHKGKWYKSTLLRDSRKGKIKTKILFQGKRIDCYISYLNVQITATKKNIKLVLVYGLGETPMMLATNKEIKSKEDAIGIVRNYMSRWRIEEYFRFKKQQFGFEGFRVRSLKAINNLNKMLTYTIGFMGLMIEKMDRNLIAMKVLIRSKSIKDKLLFYYYQIAKGINNILSFAKNGIQKWLKIRKQVDIQLSFKIEF